MSTTRGPLVCLFAGLPVLVALASAPAVAQVATWTLSADFDTGSTTRAATAGDQVVLGPTPVSQTHIVWSDNYYYGYIVRLDTQTGKQTGRFDSALVQINGVATGARPANELCNWANTGNCPGRVAVDGNGDVWIVNRAFGNQGSLTKIAGDTSRCIDRNGNGVIDTSSDVNGDGLISVVPGAGEYFGQNDECILTTLAIGVSNAIPRGVAVDRNGKIWVSTYNDHKVYRYNPNEPVAKEAEVVVPGNPYSLATGGGYLFVSSGAAGGTTRVDIETLQVQTVPCPATYGIVADPGGDVAWLGGYMSGTGAYKADFAKNTCTAVPVASAITAVTLDLAGNLWACGYSTNSLFKFSPAGVLLGTYPAKASSPHGISVDFAGNLWMVTDGGPNQVEKFDTSGQFLGSYPLGGPGVTDSTPYLYSDFTGTQLHRQAPYTYVGTWEAVHDGGVAGIPWSRVNWNTEPQGTVPARTSLSLSIRAADSLEELGTTAYAAAVSGEALSAIDGRYVQVRATLSGPGWRTPVLSDVVVEGPCVTPGETCCIRDSDCPDADPCTTDSCAVPGGACVHALVTGCCRDTAECNDGNPCTVDTCPAAGGSCRFDPIVGCCAANVECADGDPCSLDVCSGPGGTCSNPHIAGCCMLDADCGSGSVCTTVACSGTPGTCGTTPIAGCCSGDADCDDHNPCSSDTCNPATGSCSSVPVPGCCLVDGDCDDGQPCTHDRCSGPGGMCLAIPIPGCCLSDGDCKNHDHCSTVTCSGRGGSCVLHAVSGCCHADAECDDQDACTTDTCPGTAGACAHAPVEGCCRATADCDDGDRCTRDSCTFAGGACVHEALADCCNAPADCGGRDCVGGWCVARADGGLPEQSGVGDSAQADVPAVLPEVEAPIRVGTPTCGCEAGPVGAPGWLAGLLLLVLALRRRRDPAR